MAINESVCVRPILRRVIDHATDNATTVAIPCGSTRESRCPVCAKKARWLRMTQCAEGWHRDEEPEEPDPGLENPDQDQMEDDGDQDDEEPGQRRVRSTRHRQDVSDLPRVPVDSRTVGRTFTAPSGMTYRPSMFVTLTLPSYGKVVPGRGVPLHLGRYGYRRAALDALHFSKLVDRWVQNLRRGAGYKVQHFSCVEPQRRLAPHLHTALRGAIPRATVKAVTRGTYLQLWWPPFTDAVYVDRIPFWDRDHECYRDPNTGLPLPTWHQALDAADANPDTEPAHTMRFGSQVDIKGIDGGSPDADPGRAVPDQIPNQSGCRGLRRPRRRIHRRRVSSAHRPDALRAAVPAVHPRVRQLAALRRATQEPRPRPDPRTVRQQSPRPRTPRPRRTPRPGLPEMVRKDPDRAPRRPIRRCPPGPPRRRGRGTRSRPAQR
ncbi:MAG: hypothetical protein QOE58_1916 [Actinomycetota bacterium]|nr:hypothetical protein [Actinomycetota bacterium]